MKYSVKVNEVKEKEGNLRGFATVVFGDCFKITNIAILENREKGQLFVSMPRYRSNERDDQNNTVYKDICNPITREFREELHGSILDAFEHSEVQENEYGVGKDKMPEFTVHVSPFERKNSNIRGLARVYFEDNFVAMPSYKTKQTDEKGKSIYQDVCYPVTKEFREKLYGEIASIYEKQLEKKEDQNRKKSGMGHYHNAPKRNNSYR